MAHPSDGAHPPGGNDARGGAVPRGGADAAGTADPRGGNDVAGGNDARGGSDVPGAADAYDVAALGTVVRRTRQRMGLSVEGLAARSELSAGLISQLERGRGNPSLQTLSRLAGALGTQLVALLSSAQRHGEPVVRADARLVLPDIDPGEDGGARPVRELLTPDQNLPLQVIRTVMPPGFSNQSRPFRHLGLESVHVLQGRLLVALGETRHELSEGDTITYECSQAHWWANPSDEQDAIVIGSVAPFSM